MPKALTIPTIFTAIDRFTAPMRAMGASMKSFSVAASAGLARAERSFRSIMTPVTALTNKLRYFGFFGGFAFVLALRSMINIVADFQQANADLASVLTEVSQKELKMMSDSARKLGLTTARTATEVVGLQIELSKLGFKTPEILAMQGAIVVGSIAMDASLERTALLAGAMIRTFDHFKATDTPRIMDQMTLATLDTALSFEKLETMLPIVSGAANAAHVPFTRLLALLGKLSDAGIDASSSATALRNIFIDSAKRHHSYEQILENIQKHADRLTPAFNKFGKRGAVSATVLAGKLREVRAADLRYQLEATGVAASAADKRLNTFKGSVTLLKAAYQGFILTMEDGTGKYAKTAKYIIDVTRGMILLSAGTSEAMDAFNALNPAVQKSSQQWLFWVKYLGKAVLFLTALRALLWGLSIALGAFNVAMGVSAFVGLTTIKSIVGVQTSMAVLRTLLWTTTTAASRFAGVLTIAFLAISTITRNWNKMERAFQSGSIVASIGSIAFAIEDGILYPFQRMFELLGKLPDLMGGAIFRQTAKGFGITREFLGGPDESSSGMDTSKMDELRKQRAFNPTINNMLTQRNQASALNLSMDINGTGFNVGNVKTNSDSLKVFGPRIGSTMVQPNR